MYTYIYRHINSPPHTHTHTVRKINERTWYSLDRAWGKSIYPAYEDLGLISSTHKQKRRKGGRKRGKEDLKELKRQTQEDQAKLPEHFKDKDLFLHLCAEVSWLLWISL